ncbi:hypothetical protein [Frigoriflavimonas asaccharolytica]|uniref:Uncharacterized protein n=1 Tax=Frigoriflavimonas asaccharolytica TaxID=2735899 RepID=A0A8J8G9W4_9FLAO|nr:hypothetical protein [Frigoriflavimonas asaccharolytica]NRS93576.1 hypothetical protein [Frigoriflavimonas asaccharolytica]
MERHQKQHILNECHSNTIEIDDLDGMVIKNYITIEEFQQYNLEISKVNELKKRKASRENVHEEPNPDLIPDIIVFDPDKPVIFGGPKSQDIPNPTNNPNVRISIEKPLSLKESALKDIVSGQITMQRISSSLNQNVFTFDDLINLEISKKVLNSIRYYTSEHRVTLIKNIEDLPPMQEGRTDLYFVGVPKAGKSTMLGGMLNKMHRDGFLMPDTYNSAGTKYQNDLISDIDRGVLPTRTALGSYNYLAVSLKDKEGYNHPFNLVEVPGENYQRISDDGFGNENKNNTTGTEKRDFIRPFINYIKNKNKKILIFVIDVHAHENRHEADMHDALNQSLAYTNILNMFKDNGILENTDAIYLALNKFDIIRETHKVGTESDVETAQKYLEDEFKSLINNCKEARDRTKNKIKIKILPYSIGDVIYSEILERFEPSYSEILADNLMADSFVVKGGKFWKKLF